MARVPCEIRIGTGRNARAVTTEDRYLLGPAEGAWWVNFSWWVIPLGLFILFLPWFFLFEGGGGSSVQPPVVNEQVAPPAETYVPAPQPATYAPAPPPKEPDELSPEELDQRHSDYLRSQDR